MKNEPKKPEIIYGWSLYSLIVGNEWPLKLSLHDSQYVYFYLAKLKTKTKVFFQTKITQIIHLFQLTSYPWKVVFRRQKSWIWTSNYFPLFWYYMYEKFNGAKSCLLLQQFKDKLFQNSSLTWKYHCGFLYSSLWFQNEWVLEPRLTTKCA